MTHLDRVKGLGCAVADRYCGGRLTIHHLSNGAVGKRATDYEAICLCDRHHQAGQYGIAIHKGADRWRLNYGLETALLLDTYTHLGQPMQYNETDDNTVHLVRLTSDRTLCGTKAGDFYCPPDRLDRVCQDCRDELPTIAGMMP